MLNAQSRFEACEPEKMGLMLQTHGEMMKAMGEIMIKYRKLIAEEQNSEE